ncbi:MAG: hypothetical protein ACLFV5_04080 [Anaerolineales bacterium]
MKKVYLDHAVTTPARSEVLGAMMDCHEEAIGNASSLHMFGQEVKRALEGRGGPSPSHVSYANV